jgi:hypothetical protein
MTAFRLGFAILFIAGVCFYADAQQQTVSIRFVQDETAQQLSGYDNRLVLQRKAFKIQVLLSGVKGIYVHASLNDLFYLKKEDEPLLEVQNLSSLIMPEEPLNKNKEMLISDIGWSYWFYDAGGETYPFNKKLVILDSNKVVGIKSVKQFYFPEKKTEVKVKDISQPLYLFFFIPGATKTTGNTVRDFVKWKVKIDWVKSDD